MEFTNDFAKPLKEWISSKTLLWAIGSQYHIPENTIVNQRTLNNIKDLDVQYEIGFCDDLAGIHHLQNLETLLIPNGGGDPISTLSDDFEKLTKLKNCSI